MFSNSIHFITILIIGCLCFSSCSKDEIPKIEEQLTDFDRDAIGFCNGDDVANSFPINDLINPKIATIQRLVNYDTILLDTFIYGQNGFQKEIWRRAETYDYIVTDKANIQNGQLLSHYRTHNSVSGIDFLVDSLVYNSSGNLIQRLFFTLENGVFEQRRKTDYFYGANNQLESSLYIQNWDTVDTVYLRYCWDDGNIVSIRSYNGQGKIHYGFQWEFDDHPNFRRLNLLNNFYALMWCENNVVERNFNLFPTDIIIGCPDPCERKYEFNANNFPAIIYEGNSDTLIISYL